MNNNIVSFKNIKKKYSVVEALSDISFSIPKNSIFGILGANGSGKSTLMKIMPGLIKNWSGEIYYKNNLVLSNDDVLRKEFGYLIESPTFYDYLSARKNLELLARISGGIFNRIDDVLQTVNLYERAEDKVSSFSYGMKQRLGIAQVLLNDPKVIVLDEPNNGLDPNGISDMNRLIKKLQLGGKTICLSTHNLRDVEEICTDVVIFKKGVSSNTISMNNLISDSKTWSLIVEYPEVAKKIIEQNDNINLNHMHDNKLVVNATLSKKFEDIQNIFRQSGLLKINKESNLIQYFNND
jgi:ABC-2 type transport system ATP-binding protein